jgi:hypothetical protein
VPDPAAPTGWRTEQSFELREIRMGTAAPKPA